MFISMNSGSDMLYLPYNMRYIWAVVLPVAGNAKKEHILS